MGGDAEERGEAVVVRDKNVLVGYGDGERVPDEETAEESDTEPVSEAVPVSDADG